MRQLNCNLFDSKGARVPAGTLVYTDFQIDNHERGPRYGGRVEEDGRLIFRFDDCAPAGQGANVVVMLQNQAWRGRQISPAAPFVEGETIQLEREAGPNPFLPRLVGNGQFFSTEDGQPFTVIECSDFQLFQRFLHGEDLEPVLRDRQDIGFNTLRVFGTCFNMFRLFPQDFGERYFKGLPEFCELAAGFGCYVEFTAFADATIVVPAVNDQLAFWERLGTTVATIPNLLVEAVNEADQVVNRLDSLQRLKKIPGVLCSHGSNGGGQVPVRPAWDYETFHTNLQFEWWRKVGHNAMEMAAGAENLEPSGVPCVANENERHPDKTADPVHAHDAAAGAALLCAGSCFHSTSGKVSKPFEGVERTCAEAWAKGARSVALEFQRGRYVRRDDLMTAADLRVYQRVLRDGRAETVRVRK